MSEPVPAAGEALLRVRRCGICGTDVHALKGLRPFSAYPRRLGDELCLEVVTSPGGALREGDLCAAEAYFACGHCPACRAGKTNCCRELKVLGVHIDGGLAPLITMPVAKLHRSRSLAPEQVALVEPLVIGAHGAERAAIEPGEPTLIVGLGPIGLAAAIFAAEAGAKLACADVQPERLDFACGRMRLGQGFVSGSRLAGEPQDYFGQLPSVVIDATGNASSMQSTFETAEHGGRIVFLGLFNGEVSFNDPNFHRRELTLIASRAGTADTFHRVIRLLESGRIDARPLVTHRFAFAEAAERLLHIQSEPGLIKAMIDFDGF